MKVAIKLTLILAFSLNAYSAPKTANEKFFGEGTETTLSKEQVQQILPWAQNTKIFLEKLLSSAENLSYLEKSRVLIRGIRQGVLASAPHNTELSMRYVLNRANMIYIIMRKSPHANEPMAVDAQNRLLEKSIQTAIAYYKSDMEALAKAKEGESVSNITFEFAVDYQNFLNTVTQFSFDPKVNYKIQFLRVSFFQWDLFRLKDNKSYANPILETRRLTKYYPKQSPQNDQQAIHLTNRLNAEFNKLLKQMDVQIAIYFEQLREIKVAKDRSEKIKEVEVGDYVYVGYYHGHYGHVKEISSDGTIVQISSVGATRDSDTQNFLVEDIFVTTGCILKHNICVGDFYHNFGYVEALSPYNDFVILKYPGVDTVQVKELKDLYK